MSRSFIAVAWRCLVAILGVCSAVSVTAAATEIQSARVWPAAEYTRVTLESATPISYKFFAVKNPERLVLDLEDVNASSSLDALSGKVGVDDPNIKLVRTGHVRPGVLRVVFDLKNQARYQVFTLKPAGEYGHRLVVDVYPFDPMLALIQKPEGASDSPDAKPAQAAETPAEANKAPVSVAKAKEIDRTPEPVKPAEMLLPKPRPSRESSPSNVDRLILVAIDAGHGGEDPGARGANGTNEKDVTLAIAEKVKAKLEEEPGMRGVLTRDGDYFLPLQTRVLKARKIQADLFVSIHADSFVKSNARGSSVFALSDHGATSAMARWLAKRENEADLIGGVNIGGKDPYLARTLLDLSQTATINDSLKLGKAVLNELGGINALHKGAVEQAGFAVLKAPDIPSILVETAFISNPEEEQRLNDQDYQNKMASAIVAGIKRYFAKNPPMAKSRLARS